MIVVNLANLGFIFAIVVPGYTPLRSGLSAPALWILDGVFSGLALRTKVA